MTVANAQNALMVLSRALFGIGETGRMEPKPDPDDPDLAVERIETVGDMACARIKVANGDTYSVSVRWLNDEPITVRRGT